MVSAKWQMMVLFLASSALAINTAPLYPTALQKNVAYQMALTEVKEADLGLQRTQSDPISLKPDLLSAQQRLKLARASLTGQTLAVRLLLLTDLQNLDSLESQLEEQQIGLEIAQLNAQATRARTKAGAATQLDLTRAENELENAQKDLEATRKQLQDAQERFKKRYGKAADLSGEEKLGWTTAQLQTAVKSHPRVLRDHASVENADLQYQIKSSDLSPAIEVEQGRIALENARKTHAETLIEVQEGLEDALSQHQTAQSAVVAREKALKLVENQLGTQKARFQKGLVSRLQVLQAELEVQTARGALKQAQSAALKAGYGVLQAANWAPWEDQK